MFFSQPGSIFIIVHFDLLLIMNSSQISKSKAYNIAETIEYVSNSVVTKTFINRSTGNVCIMSFDTGQGLTDRILSYDTFVQIIEGKAEVMIDGNPYNLSSGESIIIPAHLSNAIRANERFKMMLTAIKPPMPRKTRI